MTQSKSHFQILTNTLQNNPQYLWVICTGTSQTFFIATWMCSQRGQDGMEGVWVFKERESKTPPLSVAWQTCNQQKFPRKIGPILTCKSKETNCFNDAHLVFYFLCIRCLRFKCLFRKKEKKWYNFKMT